ncbi:MAG: hypothetical protein RL136_1066 [Planctomycetota bacterium]
MPDTHRPDPPMMTAPSSLLLVLSALLLAGASPEAFPEASPGASPGASPMPSPAQQAAQPSPIVIAPPVVDLGVVKPGSTSPAKFTIINSGRTEVTVTAVQPNCTCTAISDIAGRRIAPGGTLELAASLAAPQAPGTKEAVVFITFDSAPPAQAKIKGEIRMEVVADPPYADALKDATAGAITLRSADGKPFKVLRSGGKDPVLVGGDAGAEPRAEYRVAWSLAGRSCEEMPLWWFIWTDRAECPVIPLRVRDECTGSKHDMARFQRFWIVKESLVVGGTAKAGTARPIEFEIEHYNPPKRGAVERPEWNQVKGVRSLVPGVEVRFIGKRDLPGASVLSVEATAAAAGMYEGELEIETATGRGRVPFTLHVTK